MFPVFAAVVVLFLTVVPIFLVVHTLNLNFIRLNTQTG